MEKMIKVILFTWVFMTPGQAMKNSLPADKVPLLQTSPEKKNLEEAISTLTGMTTHAEHISGYTGFTGVPQKDVIFYNQLSNENKALYRILTEKILDLKKINSEIQNIDPEISDPEISSKNYMNRKPIPLDHQFSSTPEKEMAFQQIQMLKAQREKLEKELEEIKERLYPRKSDDLTGLAYEPLGEQGTSRLSGYFPQNFSSVKEIREYKALSDTTKPLKHGLRLSGGFAENKADPRSDIPQSHAVNFLQAFPPHEGEEVLHEQETKAPSSGRRCCQNCQIF